MGLTRFGLHAGAAAALAVAATAVTVWAGLPDTNLAHTGSPRPAAVTPGIPDHVAAMAPVRSGSPPARGPFSLVVRTDRGEIRVAVGPLRATIRPDGTAEPIDPPHRTARQWKTAAWVEQSAYPANPAPAPSYIYGHACHHHSCAFSRLTDARLGDTITVRTVPSLVTYRVCANGLSAKAGNLVVPPCDNAPTDLVLVTCLYEHGDRSTKNLVVVATLATPEGGTR